MTVALWLLALQGAIGAFDTLYYHEWRARLPARGRRAAPELKLHAGRDFLYGSLQLYGAVEAPLAALARKLLYRLPAHRREEDRRGYLPAAEMAVAARAEAAAYAAVYPPFPTGVELCADIASGLLVSGGRLLVHRDARFARSRVDALLQHEVGTHLLTLCNGRAQKLRLLACGLPGHETLQEGLAVLAEHLAGGLSRPRLRLLAARVVACHGLGAGAGFVDTFRELVDDCGYPPREAFDVAVRVHRGGGLTKDACYLRGLVRVLDHLGAGGALEPLFVGKIAIRHLPAVEELSTNLAWRYSNYESFGSVDSWKAGLNWRMNESIRLRGTLSSDIRAPNLNDLYQPAGVSSTGFVDLLTGGNNSLRLVSRGNPDLVPEEARTVTIGAVLTPGFIPRFTLAVDYYRTRIENAITGVSYQNNAIQNICMASAPTFDSPFCSLAIRPITDPTDPNYRNPNFNFPTEVINSPLNAAQLKLHGYDFQIDYNWEVGGGQVTVRHLASYQPENTTVNIPGAFPTWAVQPELSQSTFVTYRKSGWTFAAQNRWLSGVNVATSDNSRNGNSQNYVEPRLPSFNVVDTTVSKEFEIAAGKMEAFLTVSNLLNERAPLYGSNSGLPGLFYPTLGFYDDMGRFFTVGAKVKF